MIPGRLLFRHKFNLVPSCGSVFVYMIPPEKLMSYQSESYWHKFTPGSCTYRSEIFIPIIKFIPVSDHVTVV